MSTPSYRSATELATQIRQGKTSPVTVVEACFERIHEYDDELNAFVTLLEDEARQAARDAEQAVQEGREVGPLHGIPVAIKDLFDFKAGVRNTFGSKPFAEFVPETTATYVQRLEDAGAIIIGKTNTPEFGHKGTTDNRLFGPTSTPFNVDYNAGGSSGGSAAAVAAGLVPLAQGTDAGGSDRIPAALCGICGFKPSYGRVAQQARPDAFATHTPFLHASPLARTVEDTALMLDVMSGPHPRDPFSVPDDGAEFLQAVRQGVDGFRIAYSPNLDVFPVEPEVTAIVNEATEVFKQAGATVEHVDLGIDYSHQELTEIWNREFSILCNSVLEGFKADGLDLLEQHADALTTEFVELVEKTEDFTTTAYKRDEHVRTEIFDIFQDIFAEYDLLVTPTVAVPAIKNQEQGETVGPTEVNGESVDPLVGWCLTHPINFTGHPAASVPAGFTDDNFPVGMQLIGRRFADETVFAASGTFERAQPWYDAYETLI